MALFNTTTNTSQQQNTSVDPKQNQKATNVVEKPIIEGNVQNDVAVDVGSLDLGGLDISAQDIRSNTSSVVAPPSSSPQIDATKSVDKPVSSGVAARTIIGQTAPAQVSDVSHEEGLVEVNAASMRFLNTRYWIFILIIFLLGVFVVYPRIDQAYSDYQVAQAQYNQTTLRIKQALSTLGKYKRDKDLVSSITTNTASLVRCFALGEKCDKSLIGEMKKKQNLVKYYFQLGSLTTQKMQIDEKKILEHIDTYLLLDNPYAKRSSYLGTLMDIDIGSPINVKDNLMQAPVEMKITFASKDEVLTFLKRLEDRLYFTDKDKLSRTILYTIDSVSYDIMKYDEEQEVSVSLIAWFVK